MQSLRDYFDTSPGTSYRKQLDTCQQLYYEAKERYEEAYVDEYGFLPEGRPK